MQNSFEMKVQGIDRTLADKVFAVCDYYLQGKVAKHSRHLYDIYKLLPLVPQDENFRELVKEVRAVRAQSVVCPSALPEANVPELLEKIIKEKAYKQDYDSLTTQLLEENVPYDTVIATLKKVAESSIFENTHLHLSANQEIAAPYNWILSLALSAYEQSPATLPEMFPCIHS